jgi:prepilin-type N-terminal cleavage/methylation domain-containing protein
MIYRKLFTLIELVVVIAIIALLFSLLNPSIKSALMAARSIQCQNNEKTMGVYTSHYSEDHGNKINLSHSKQWFLNLSVYAGIDNYATTQNHDPDLRFSEIICPQTNIDDNFQKQYGNWAFIGTSKTSWKAGRAVGSYGANLWATSSFTPIMNDSRDNFAATIFDFKSPSKTPLIGDSIWYGSWPEKNDLFPQNNFLGYEQHQRGYFMGRFAIDRHNWSINFNFIDGSVKNIELEELWSLAWHNNWSQ